MNKLTCHVLSRAAAYCLSFLSLMSSGCQQRDLVDTDSSGSGLQANSYSNHLSPGAEQVTALVIDGVNSRIATLDSVPQLRIVTDPTLTGAIATRLEKLDSVANNLTTPQRVLPIEIADTLSLLNDSDQVADLGNTSLNACGRIFTLPASLQGRFLKNLRDRLDIYVCVVGTATAIVWFPIDLIKNPQKYRGRRCDGTTGLPENYYWRFTREGEKCYRETFKVPGGEPEKIFLPEGCGLC
jgi:hypothetical protein